jgi:hypothetical protein
MLNDNSVKGSRYSPIDTLPDEHSSHGNTYSRMSLGAAVNTPSSVTVATLYFLTSNTIFPRIFPFSRVIKASFACSMGKTR